MSLNLTAADVEKLQAWADLWEVPGLEERVEFRFSTRMYRTLGRYHPQRHEIRLASFLKDTGWEELFQEVLCHEAAHAACFERSGWDGKPHGAEWKSLMRAAGFAPRARLPMTDELTDLVRARRAGRRSAEKSRATGQSRKEHPAIREGTRSGPRRHRPSRSGTSRRGSSTDSRRRVAADSRRPVVTESERQRIAKVWKQLRELFR